MKGILLATLAAACFAGSVYASELAGTAWQLVSIRSMDDTVDVPDDPSVYTLEFGAGGRGAIRADCNRGVGEWTSQGPGQLVFGPIAATRVMCLPGSLADKYLAHFEWIRSYVLRDGRLFLATMADGPIIEFEPLPPIVATVLGEDIRGAAAEVQDAVLGRLFDAYASKQGIEVAADEVDAYLDTLRRGKAKLGLVEEIGLTPEEATRLEVMRKEMARAMIRRWKINRSLFAAFGGRIIYQQLGPEPLDAYREFLEAHERAGDFRIHDAAIAASFWRYFTDESIHEFMDPGGEDAARAFVVPLWRESQ